MTTADLINKNESPANEAGIAQDSGHVSLFDDGESNQMRSNWQRIQSDFVDDPKASVEKADELVAGAIKRLAEIFAKERADLESEWSRGGEVSTEDLRQALRRYRSFFDRLLNV
jgi:hypothetical protein